MRQLRSFIVNLRERFEVPYPLAHFKPFVGAGKTLLLAAQQEAELPDELSAVYEVTNGQLILAASVVGFIEQVKFAEQCAQEATKVLPAGRSSPVVIDPMLSSGAPTVMGIRTESIVEMVKAGTPVEQVAADFGVEVDIVRAAVAFE